MSVPELFDDEPEKIQQLELFKAETRWFHVFKSMIASGDVAKMGPYAFTVYSVIKAHTSFSKGHSFPEISTIVEESGISKAQVHRALDVLEELGYVRRGKKPSGRGNLYIFREKVDIEDKQGNHVADASWDYLPLGVSSAIAELKHVKMTGDFSGAKIVQIENLTVNVNTANDSSIQINIQTLMDNMEMLPKELKEILVRRLAEMQLKSPTET